MSNDEVEFLIDLLKTITIGCPKHHYYKGKTPPTTKCEMCSDLYKAYKSWEKFCELNEIK